MKRLMLTLTLAATAAIAVAQEDTLRKRDGTSVTGRLISAAADFVKLEPAGEMVPIDYKSEEVAEVTLDRSNVPSSYFKGENEQKKGNYDLAIKHYTTAAADASAPAYMKQFALYEIAECCWAQGKIAEWEKALDGLRTQIPDTFYLWTIYWRLTDYYIGKKDLPRAEKVIKDFDGAASKYPTWRGGANFRRAQLSQAQGKYDDALRLYAGLKSDRVVGEDARVYELRCMAEKGDLGGARARGNDILNSKETSARVLTGAYNCIGDALMKEGNLKEAMKAYLRGITEYDRAAAGTDMHEYSLAMSAITLRKYGDALSDATKKGEYAGKAALLLKELAGRYPGSPLIPKVQEALK